MDKDEVLKMAIEALEDVRLNIWLADKFDVYNLNKAFFACKEALEQPAPAKVWVELSDDELMELLGSKGETSIKYLDFARAIEAKLKEKNHE